MSSELVGVWMTEVLVEFDQFLFWVSDNLRNAGPWMGVGGGAQPSAIIGSCFVLMAMEESDGSPVGGAANSPAPDDGSGSAGLAGLAGIV